MTPSWVDERVIGLFVPTPRFPRNTPGKNAVLNLICLNEWKYDVWEGDFQSTFFLHARLSWGIIIILWTICDVRSPSLTQKNGSKGRALSWCCCCTLLYLLWGAVCCRSYLPLLLNIQEDESRTCHATQQHMLSLKKEMIFLSKKEKSVVFRALTWKKMGKC